MQLFRFHRNPDQKKDAKKGWNFGVLPAVTYNTDLGLQSWRLDKFVYYGDGTKYPQYLHNIYFEFPSTLKGSAIYRLAYDSEYLIPGVRITSDLAYLPDRAFEFLDLMVLNPDTTALGLMMQYRRTIQVKNVLCDAEPCIEV